MKINKGSAPGGGGGTVTSVTASAPLASSGGANPDISLAGTIPIANGGTGQATANTALNALLPAQGGHAGEMLSTDGVNTSWSPASTGRTNLGIQAGTDTLVAGTVTITATVTASSRIIISTQNAIPGAGNLTISLAVPLVDRTVGAPGSFVVRANIATGTINVLDTSTFDWTVIG